MKDKKENEGVVGRTLAEKIENLERVLSEMRKKQDMINAAQESINNSMMKIVSSFEIFVNKTNASLADQAELLELHQSVISGLEENVYMANQIADTQEVISFQLPELDKKDLKKFN